MQSPELNAGAGAPPPVDTAVLNAVIDAIFDAVNIRSLDRSTVGASTQLGPGGVGLDSVDILEAVVAIEYGFKVKIANKEVGQAVFRSFGTIAAYVAAHSPLFSQAAAAAP